MWYSNNPEAYLIHAEIIFSEINRVSLDIDIIMKNTKEMYLEC